MKISYLFMGVAPFVVMVSVHAEVATVGVTQQSGDVRAVAAHAPDPLDSATSTISLEGNKPGSIPTSSSK